MQDVYTPAGMNMLLQVTNYEFDLIKKLIYEKAGIYLRDSKKALVSNRLRKRLKELGFDSYKKYHNFIANTGEGRSELVNFIDALTTNETYFFRNPKQFSLLETVIIPEIIMERGADPVKNVKVWSAACSTGEEPYSIAILLREKLPDYEKWNINIMATDINREVISKAQKGVYKPYAVGKMSRNYILKYFKRNRAIDMFELDIKIKKMVKFYNHNLMEPFRCNRADVIFCRNVMIYFDRSSKEKVFANLAKSLRTGGYLFIGHAETLMNCNLPFKYMQPSIYQRI